MEIKSYSNHHVDAVIHSENGSYWRCTSVYGHSESDQKRHTWELLRRLAALSSLPLLCFGDFNEVLDLNEKSRAPGGGDKRANLVNDFGEAIRDSDLIDLGSTGYPFAWSNKRFGPNFIEERLDRFLCNSKWRSYFIKKAAMNLISWSSDHNLIVMDVVEREEGRRYIKRIFPKVHYEDMWSLYKKCKKIVKHEWLETCCWENGNYLIFMEP